MKPKLSSTLLLTILLSFSGLSFCKHHCQTNSACHEALSPKYSCDVDRGICVHESLATLSKQYIIGIIIIIFISAFANAGGIGGGSVIVPALTILFQYEVNEAIPLSKGTIFAGAVINVFFLLNQRKKENKNKSLIDYRLCAFMLPIMMCGTFFGVYLNFIFPPMIIILLLTGYLVLSIFGLYSKYKIISQKEDEKLQTTLREQIEGTYKNACEGLRGHRDRLVDQLRLWTIGPRNNENNDDGSVDRGDRNFEGDDEIPIPDLEAPELATELDINMKTASEEQIEIENRVVIKPDSYDGDTIAGDSHGVSSQGSQTLKSTIMSIKESYLNRKPKISFIQMMKNNMVFILILTCSILIIVFLSLLKEGVFSRSGNGVDRCSRFGLAIMGVIAIFCFTIATIAFHFNITKEQDELTESVSHEMNRPLEVINDLNASEKERQSGKQPLEDPKQEPVVYDEIASSKMEKSMHDSMIFKESSKKGSNIDNIPSITVKKLKQRTFDFRDDLAKNKNDQSAGQKNLNMSQVFHASMNNDISLLEAANDLEQPFSDAGSTTTYYYSMNEENGAGSTFSKAKRPNASQVPTSNRNILKQLDMIPSKTPAKKMTQKDLKDCSNKKSLRTLMDDNRSLRSGVSIETIIDESLQDKKSKLMKLGGVSFIAGTGAGFLGIGGGMIINPFLVIMNYSPLDAMAISSMGVLFTSSISTSEFLIMKAIRFSDLSYFLVIAGIGSLCGVFIIKAMITKFNRPSILLMIILGIFIFAVIVLPTFGILTIPMSRYFLFGTVCE